MRKSRISKFKQLKLVEHFVAGTTARCAASLIGVNIKTAAITFKDFACWSLSRQSRQQAASLAERLKSMRAILVGREKAIEDEALPEKSPFLVC